MALTWPIDTVEPADIPAFGDIFSEYDHKVADLNGMLRYFCYRFDPKWLSAKEKVTIERKDAEAAKLAGWEPPIAKMEEDDDGNQVICFEYAIFLEILGAFFEVLDNDEWEFIVSLDIAIHNGNMIIREPILGDDPEVKGKILLNIQKAIKGNEEAIALRKSAAMRIADQDEVGARAIMTGTKAKKNRKPISPEGFLSNGED